MTQLQTKNFQPSKIGIKKELEDEKDSDVKFKIK